MKLFSSPSLSYLPLNNKEFIFYFLDLLKTSQLEFLDIFEDKEYCNELFALNYPLLVDITDISRFDLVELTTFSGKKRYYAYKQENIFTLGKNKYLVTNHWYPKNRELLMQWIEQTA